MKKLSIFLLFVCCGAIAQQVYVSVDKNGVPLYSDKLVAGAQKLELKVSPHSQSQPQASSDYALNRLTEADASTYQLEILKPDMEGTVISNQGEVLVQSQVSPELAAHHKLRLVLDNNQQSPLQHSSNFRLLGVKRGAHQLQLQALDQNGKLIAESPVTTFYLRKTTIASPK